MPDASTRSATAAQLLAVLGLTVAPVLLAVGGFFLGMSSHHGLVLGAWIGLGLLAGVPALLAARALPRGRPRSLAVVLGWLGSAVGAVAAGAGALVGAAIGAAAHGRPLRRGGQPVSAPVVPGGAWAGDVRPAVAAIDPALREALAAAWLEDARLEHAAVAAFARLSLDLLAVGAPPALLRRCHRAADEEIEHARQAFALASAYAGCPLGPGLFPEAAAGAELESPARTRARLAVEALVDGCIGEGVAAASLAEAAVSAEPAVASVLRAAARDEAEHAELSWDVLAWAVSEGGADVARAAQRALDALDASAETRSRWPGALADAMAAHGRLPAARERAIRGAVLTATRERWTRLRRGGGGQA
jgi:hypothetical protein